MVVGAIGVRHVVVENEWCELHGRDEVGAASLQAVKMSAWGNEWSAKIGTMERDMSVSEVDERHFRRIMAETPTVRSWARWGERGAGQDDGCLWCLSMDTLPVFHPTTCSEARKSGVQDPRHIRSEGSPYRNLPDLWSFPPLLRSGNYVSS